MHLQLLWVQCQSIRHVVFGTLTGEGSQGVCAVSPPGHISSPGPLNERTETGSEQARSKTLSFTYLHSLSRTKGDAEHQAAAGPGPPSDPQGCSINLPAVPYSSLQPVSFWHVHGQLQFQLQFWVILLSKHSPSIWDRACTKVSHQACLLPNRNIPRKK